MDARGSLCLRIPNHRRRWIWVPSGKPRAMRRDRWNTTTVSGNNADLMLGRPPDLGATGRRGPAYGGCVETRG